MSSWHGWLVRVAALVGVLSCFTAVGMAQGLSDMRGTVEDTSGGALPGVSIVITNQASGTYREVVSNADGSWYVPGLTPGTYQVSAELTGFKRFLRRDLAVVVGTTTTVPISLELGTLEETITVTGESPIIDVTSKQIGGNLNTQDLTELPSLSRNWLGFAALLPGVIQVPNLASWGSETISANGVDTRNNSFLVDGAWDNDDYLGQNNGGQVRVPIEGVQESQILIGQYDAEFGRTSGAIVNAVTKSGTNSFHGAGFVFYTNKSMRAEDFFVNQNNLQEPDVEKREYGGALGGPVIKDKAHFFANIERVWINEGRTIQIPPRPELNWATVTQVRAWNHLYRFDHQINSNHSWSVRWLGEWSPQTGQTNNLAVTPEGRQREWDLDQHTNVALNSVLGRNIVNQFRFGWTREDDRFAQIDFSACPSGGFDACSDQNLLEQQNVGANISYLTFFDGPRNVGTHWITNSPEISETLSWFIPDKKGDHDLKFGTKYYFTTWTYQNHAQINGQFVIPSNGPFNAANPRTYPERLSIRVGNPLDFYMKGHFIGMFAQDRWSPIDRLTISAGLRYDVELVRTPNQWNPQFTDDPGGFPVDADNFAPRAGFTYAMDEQSRSVLRGGFGVFYQRTSYTFLTPMFSSGRFSDSFTALFPTNNADPGPRAGNFPTNPLLVNGPVVNHAAVDAQFPPGTLNRNTGTVRFDNPDRTNAYSRQYSIGYERQIGATLGVSVDYIRSEQRGQYMLQDLNPGLRDTTTATSTLRRRYPLVGAVGEFAGRVDTLVNEGYIDYNTLQVSVTKRQSAGFSGRVSYAYSRGRGNVATGQADTANSQLLGDLNLGNDIGPTNVDRPHILSVAGSYDVPRTRGLKVSGVLQARSGTPFTLIDSTFDLDRNGLTANEYLPAGTYRGTGDDAITVDYKGGRNGARGPSYVSLDLRAGYAFRLAGGRTLNAFVDIFNLTNEANFANPGSDRRATATFLRYTGLVNGVTRTFQLNVRFGF